MKGELILVQRVSNLSGSKTRRMWCGLLSQHTGRYWCVLRYARAVMQDIAKNVNVLLTANAVQGSMLENTFVSNRKF